MFVDLCKDVQSHITEFVCLPDLLNLGRVHPDLAQICMPLLKCRMEHLNATFPEDVDECVNSQVSDLLLKIQGESMFSIPFEERIEDMAGYISDASTSMLLGVVEDRVEYFSEGLSEGIETFLLMFECLYGREDFDINQAMDSLIASHIRSIIEDGCVKMASEVIRIRNHLDALNKDWSNFRRGI